LKECDSEYATLPAFFKFCNITIAPDIIGSGNQFITMRKFWHRAAADSYAAGNDEEKFIH